MNPLIEKLKKNRETEVEAGGFKFTVRRPTDMQIADMRDQDIKQGDILERFVVGWSGVRELDIIPSGSAMEIPFDTGVFMEWVADHPELWVDLCQAAITSYETHQARLTEKVGEPDAG